MAIQMQFIQAENFGDTTGSVIQNLDLGEQNATPGLNGYDANGLWEGHTGEGYLNIEGAAGDKATFTFEADEVGPVEVTVRLAVGSNARSIALRLDGAQTSAQSTSGTDWTEWVTKTFTLNVVTPGTQTVTLVQTTATGPNIDAVAVHAVGVAPEFLAPNVDAPDSFDIQENTGTLVGQIGGADPEGDALTFGIDAAAGDDGALFAISATGELSFLAAPDFESGPASYQVTVTVDDGTTTAGRQVTVNVLNDPADDPVTTPFETLFIEGEAFDIVETDGASSPTLVRTATQNPERDNATIDVPNQGTGSLPDFDPVTGLRPDHSGAGYMDINGSGLGPQVSTSFDAPAGNYDIVVRLGNGSGPRPINVVVDGQSFHIADTSTGQWYQWETRTVTVNLSTSGPHTLVIEQDDSSGAPNIDAVAIAETGARVDFFAPEITGTALIVDENDTDAGVVAARDLDGDPLGYVITGGADADKVLIDPGSGAVSLNAAPDFESPADADGDNVYEVTVEVTDGATAVSEAVTITVVDDPLELPEPTIDPIVIQSETAALSSVDDASFHRTQTANAETAGTPDEFGLRGDYSGFGYTDFNGDGPNQSLTFTFNVASAGLYDLTVRYTSPDSGRPLDLAVGGAFVEQISFAGGNFESFVTLTRSVALEAGDNSVTLSIPSGVNNGPNIDAVALTTVGETPAFPAANSQPGFDALTPSIAVDENTGGAIGAFAASDADAGETVSYGLSGDDADDFTISATGELSFVAMPDHETPTDADGDNVYQVTVTADDGKAPAIAQDVTVTVNDVDEAPDAPQFSGDPSLPGDAAAGLVVGTLSATDPEGGAVTFTVDDPRFVVTGSDLVVAEGADFSADEGTSIDVVVTASDPTLNSADTTVSLSVGATDAPATAIVVTAVPVAENTAGALVAEVSVSDPDTTYTAADLALEGADAGLFELVDGASGVELNLAPGVELDFEAATQPQVSVAVGALASDPFTPEVTDVPEGGPVQILFTDLTGFSGQNRPQDGGAGISTADGDATLTLSGNFWQRAALAAPYVITADTRLTVDFQAGAFLPELIAVGIDSNNTPFDSATGLFFELAGTQTVGGVFSNMRNSSALEDLGNGWVRATLDLSPKAGETISSVIFVSDDDVPANGMGSASFTNAFLTEGGDTGGNSAPRVVGGGISDFPLDEGASIEVSLAFVDDDGDPLDYTVTAIDAGGVDVTGAFGFAIEDGTLTGGHPESLAAGIYTVTIEASDGTASASDTFAITVVDVNDAPTAADAAFEPVFGAVGEEIAPVDLALFTGVFSDPDGDPLVFRVEGLPAGLELNSEGVIVGTPLEAGSGTFRIIASDPEGLEASIEVILEITTPGIGDVVDIEAEAFTALASATNFLATGQPGASGNQIISVTAGQSGAIETLLSGNGVVPGWYVFAIDVYDETDGSATFSLDIGGTLLADGLSFDSDGVFLNPGVARGSAGQAGNLKRISFDEPVFVDAETIARITGQADGELLRIDRLLATRIEAPNAAPTAIALDTASIGENLDGATIGTLSATDPDGDDAAVTFSVEDPRFEVVAGDLRLRAGESLDFEAGDTVTVTVTAADAAGGESSSDLVVTVVDSDEAPEAVGLDNTNVAENAAGATVGALSAVDPEGGAVAFEVDDARFEVVGGLLKLKDGEALDAESESVVTVQVTATDAGLNATVASFDISVSGENEAPVLVPGAELAAVTLPLGAGQSVDLAALGASDPDGDVTTYDVRLADGGSLPAGVSVAGDMLTIPADLASGLYAFEVFATDGSLESEPVALSVTVEPAGPFQTVFMQGEAFTLIADGDADPDNDNLVRTETQNQERDGVNNPDDPDTPDNPGLPDFNEFGIRPDYTEDGYLDINGVDTGLQATSPEFFAPAGSYEVTLRIAHGSAGQDRPITVKIGDATAQIASTFTGQWYQWETRTVSLTLTGDGPHVVEILQDGTQGAPNIDAIAIHLPGETVDFTDDTSADEDGNLAASAADPTVADAELGAVDFRLSGVDADIVAYEVSLDDGANFAPVSPVEDGLDRVVTLDLSAFAGSAGATVQFRVTDNAGNQAVQSAAITIQDDPVEAYFQEIQLESRAGDVTIIDDTPGTDDAALTQPRDALNPEEANADRGPDGLWDGFTGAGYLDMGLNVGDAASFEIDAPEAGTYTFTFRYGNGGDADRPMALSVGGATVATIDFAPTADWGAWTEVAVEVSLAAGVNTIAIANTIATGPNLDRVIVSRDGDVVDPGTEPGPRETIQINFQDGTAPKAAGYLVDNFQGFADRGNGLSYGWVTEASAIDADGTSATPIDAGQFPAIAINERSGGVFDSYDARLTGYAHFDLGSYPGRTAWEIALDDGWYEVTVSVGDTGGANDSANRLFVEGSLATAWVPTDTFKSQLITTLANVQDGFLTLSGQGGTITEMQYLEIRELPDLTPGDGNGAPADYASFSDARAVSGVGANQVTIDLDPGDGARPEGVDPTSDIFVGIDVVEGRGGALLASLADGSVKLYETLTGQEVSININTTGGFDSLTVSPLADLKENTSYTLLIDGFQDRGPNDDPSAPTREFQKFSTSFTTGEAPEIIDREVAFDDSVELNGAADGAFGFTSAEMSPDKTFFYVTTISGEIKRWAVNSDGSLDKSSEETFSPGGDFVTSDGRRGFIGITFDPENPDTIWVTDNYPIPLSGRDNGVPDFSGRISKVELGAGGSLETASISTYMHGFPRSNGDHVTNSLEFRANPDAGQPGEPNYKLYLIQGSNSAMGQADSAWGLRPERLLNAAVMEIDHTRTPPAGGFDVATEPLPGDGLNRRFADGDGDLKNGGILISNAEDATLNGKFLHFDANGAATVRETADPGSELFKAYYDPFAPDAVLSIFATGQRNAYDLVWHSNGFLYVPTNGSASGGNVPNDPDTPANEGINGVGLQNDYLFRIVEGGYYGHPNPVRDEFVMNGGNPTAGADKNQVNNYPVGTQPDPNYDIDGAYSLGTNRSPNGAIEYMSPVFGSSLQNALLFVEYSGGDDVRVVLLGQDGTPVQDFVLQDTAGQTISYTDPLDIIEGADGRLYLLTLNRGNGQSQIVRLEPAPGGVVSDTTADAGGDLALVVFDGTDASAIVFQVNGLDDDIVSLSVSFDGGATSESVNLDGQNRFVADLSAAGGQITATLTVIDDDTNTATDSVSFTPGEAVTPQGFYDGADFTNLDPGSTIIRLLGNPATHEDPTSGNDGDGDGLNDGHDGNSYVDFGGGVGDKASLDIVVAQAGVYDIVLRMANGSVGQARPIDVTIGGQSVSIADTNTGSFTTWQDFPIQLTLEAGVNTVVFTQTNAQGGPNIDSATVTLDTALGVPNDGTETVGGVDFTRYEAENAALDGAVVVEEARNQSGDFVDYDGAADQTITWTISVPEAGIYQIDVLYALAASKGARPLDLTINGTPAGAMPFVGQSNEDETNWFPQTATVTLQAGVNTIALTAPGAVGPNVDYLRVSQAPVDVFEPDYAAVDGETRIELEQTADNSTRVVNASTAEFYFTVAEDGDYAFDLAANPGADGGGLTLLLTSGNAQPVEIDESGFPGIGDAGETTAYASLQAGVQYRLTVVSDQPGANALDYLDVRPAPGNPNADIAVQSLDPTFFGDRLHFSYLANPDAVEPGNDRSFKDRGTVRISNTGTEPLEILEADIDGPYSLVSPATLEGLTIASGAFVDVTVMFDGASVPARANNVSGVVEGALTLRTNDSDSPVATVDLAGFWQARDEGGNEPTINEVWEILGFGTRVEGMGFVDSQANNPLDNQDIYEAVNALEVLSPYWRIADGVTEARITQIAAFHGISGATVGIHAPGSKAGANDEVFWNHANTDNQTLFPLSGGGFSTETFTIADIPDGWAGDDVFGIEVADFSTDPTLNSGGPGTVPPGTQRGHFTRIFVALDEDGNVIPNTYLGIQDYTGINYDYNDNMFVIEGVTPVGAGQDMVISGLDAAAPDDRLVFSRIDAPANGSQTFRDTASFEISNEGSGPLTLTGLGISGGDPGAFEIVSGPADGTVLAAGASATVTVAFIGTDPANDDAAVLYEATLEVASNDFDSPLRSIALAGLAQIQSEGGEEPTVAEIVQAFGYGTDMAQGALSNGGQVETVGDEVLMPYMERLDVSRPVEVIQLAAYLSLGNLGRLNLHGLQSDELTGLYAQDGASAQSVLPQGPGGTSSSASFAPGAPFGLKVTVDGRPTFSAWSDPIANLEDDAFNLGPANEGHYLRFFQARGADGGVIPGTFIAIQDYPGGENFDYNDHMFLIRNVQPHALTAAEDAGGNGINDALETDADGDGVVAFFDNDDAPTPDPVQQPFNPTQSPWAVDADGVTLEAVSYDDGGQGVAYNDAPGLTGGGNGGRAGSDVEVTTGGAVGWIETGEWLEYTINVTQAGSHSLAFLSALGTTGAQRTITATFANGAGVYETVVVDVDPTGSWTSFQPTETASVDLQAGEQVVRLTFDGSQDLASFTLTLDAPVGDGQAPFGGTAPVVGAAPLLVQAVNYDEGGQDVAYNDAAGIAGGSNGGRAGSDVEVTGSNAIGWIEDGEWLEYTINVTEAGSYTLDFLAARGSTGGPQRTITATFANGAGMYESVVVDVDPTGSWTSFQPTDAASVDLQAGEQVVRLTFNGGDQDLASFTLTPDAPVGGAQTPFGGTAPVLGDAPLTVLAASFDEGGQGVSWNDNPGRDNGAQAQRADTDVELVGGPQDIGHVLAGEWVEYTINVEQAGTYALSLDAKSPIAGNSIAVSLDGGAALATFALPDSNGASTGFGGTTFASTPAIEVDLQAGLQTLRFTFDGSPSTNGYVLDMRSFTLDGVDEPVPGPSAIGYSGVTTFAQSNSGTWFSIDFPEEMIDPVVVLGPATLRGSAPLTMRVQNVTSTGFEFQLDEWDYLDGGHIAETVGWFAIERGLHDLGGGLIIEAGTAVGGTSATSVALSGGFTGTPAILTQATGVNEPGAITARTLDVAADEFSFLFQEEEEADGVHGPESLDWIAVSQGAFDELAAGVTGATVNHNQSVVSFGGTYEGAFMASIQGLADADPATLRMPTRDATSATIFVDEESSQNPETTHGSEFVAWLVLDDDILLA